MSDYIDGVGKVDTPKTFKEKLVNFWYHYKWHTIVAAFVILALIVCISQCSAKPSYDIQILYAGSAMIKVKNEGADFSDIENMMSSSKRVVPDIDGDSEQVISITNYFYLSAEEKDALGDGVNEALLESDRKSLDSVIQHSEIYLCFISEAVYNSYKGENGERFASLNEYKEKYKEKYPPELFYADNAIRLSMLDLYKLPGFASLPDDTLICIRTANLLAANSKDHKEAIKNANTVLENILNYSIG